MYFPGDPLFALDPIYQSITDPKARERARRDLRPRPDAARVGHRLPLGHRAHRLAPHPARGGPRDMHATARPDRRPVLRLRAALRRRRGPRRRPAHPDAVRLHGTVYDGAGDPVPDALLEIWQADARGQRADGRGLAAPRRLDLHRLRARGHRRRWALHLHHVRADGDAPFIAMTVFARGLLDRLFTRVYLPDHADAPVPAVGAGRPPLDAGRRGRRRWATCSTYTSRASTRPSSSTSQEPDDRPVLARRRAGRLSVRPGIVPRGDGRRRGRVAGGAASTLASVRSRTARTHELVAAADLERVATSAEAGGNPVIPLVDAAARRLTDRGPRGRRVAPPRAHQPGRARHRPGAAVPGPRRRRSAGPPRRVRRPHSARSPTGTAPT